MHAQWVAVDMAILSVGVPVGMSDQRRGVDGNRAKQRVGGAGRDRVWKRWRMAWRIGEEKRAAERPWHGNLYKETAG